MEDIPDNAGKNEQVHETVRTKVCHIGSGENNIAIKTLSYPQLN